MINKIVTFSFDDGADDDLRVIEILNRYGLKGTFNLNSSSLSSAKNGFVFKDIKNVSKVDITEHIHAYDGHEIACHSYSHPRLENLSRPALRNEIVLDKMILSMLAGYEVRGMAYPFGSYNNDVIKMLRDNGIVYSRGTTSSYGFCLPDNLYDIRPTCHVKDMRALELAKDFVALEADCPQMLYLWGHSFEFVSNEDWSGFERLCSVLAGHDDIRALTNIEMVDEYVLNR